MQEYTFPYQDENLKYYSAGSPDNPPIILIHGFISSHYVWRQTIPSLEENFYCIAIDLMGHGKSDIVPDGDYSIEAQAKRVLALADELGFEKFIVIGHSMGGQIAMYIASVLAPQRIIKLINVDGVASGHLVARLEAQTHMLVNATYYFPLLESFSRRVNTSYRWGAYIQFKSWFYNFDVLPFEDWRIDREMANRPGIRYTWYHGLHAILNLDLSPYIAKITVPALSIFGKQDSVVPLSDAYLVDEHIPNSQLVVIDNCGHFPMYEASDTYLKAVREFLL